MNIEVKKIDKIKRVIRVCIEGKELANDQKEVYTELGKNLRVSGFRQGTAPLDVLARNHGDRLKQEFVNKMLPDYYRKAIEDAQLSPVGLPHIRDVELAKDSLVFFAEVEVKPSVEPKESDYKGIKVTLKKVAVSDDDISKVIANLIEGIKKVLAREVTLDEAAHWAGYPSAEALKEAIQAEIKVEKLRQRKREVEQQVVQHLLKKIPIDPPQTEVDRYHKELVEREMQNLRVRGVIDSDMETYKHEIEEKLKTMAVDEVKLFYILEGLAEKESLKVDRNMNVGEVVLGYLLSNAEFME